MGFPARSIFKEREAYLLLSSMVHAWKKTWEQVFVATEERSIKEIYRSVIIWSHSRIVYGIYIKITCGTLHKTY